MGEVPAWSGEFFEFEGDDVAVLSIHAADQKSHQPPEGWKLESIYVDTEADCQSFVYVRVA